MTDEQIIKALECCTQNVGCNGCPFVNSTDIKYRGGYACAETMRKSALNLINRQKEEIERLNIELQFMRNASNSYKIHYETTKSEAIKEFAERLKIFIIPQKADGYTREIVLKRDIDNLVKEMTEVDR